METKTHTIFCQLDMSNPAAPQNTITNNPQYFLMCCMERERSLIPIPSTLKSTWPSRYSILRKMPAAGSLVSPDNIEIAFPYIYPIQWPAFIKNWDLIPTEGGKYFLSVNTHHILNTEDTMPIDVYLGLKFVSSHKRIPVTPIFTSKDQAQAFDITYFPSSSNNTFLISCTDSDSTIWYLRLDSAQLADPHGIKKNNPLFNPFGVIGVKNPTEAPGAIWGIGPAAP